VHEEAKVLVEAGHDVTILCWNRGENYPSREIIDGIKIWRITVPSSYGVPTDFVKGITLFYLRALKLLRHQSFDVVHAHDFDTLPLAVKLKKLHGWKVVYDAHDLYASMIADVMPSPAPSLVSKLERFLLNYTDARIAASEAIAKHLSSKHKFEIVLNAKNLAEYQVPSYKLEELRTRVNPERKFLIVYIGILKLWTPLPQLIEAVKRLKDVKLLVGGKGPHEKEIIEMLKDADNIQYLGWVNKKDIPLYTLISDIIVLPSNSAKLYTKAAVPNKIMEALAAGKPVIAGTDTEGGRIVRECDAGLLCKYGDVECLVKSLKTLMENRELYSTYAQNARLCAERKYNWEIMKNRLISLYSKLQ